MCLCYNADMYASIENIRCLNIPSCILPKRMALGIEKPPYAGSSTTHHASAKREA